MAQARPLHCSCCGRMDSRWQQVKASFLYNLKNMHLETLCNLCTLRRFQIPASLEILNLNLEPHKLNYYSRCFMDLSFTSSRKCLYEWEIHPECSGPHSTLRLGRRFACVSLELSRFSCREFPRMQVIPAFPAPLNDVFPVLIQSQTFSS